MKAVFFTLLTFATILPAVAQNGPVRPSEPPPAPVPYPGPVNQRPTPQPQPRPRPEPGPVVVRPQPTPRPAPAPAPEERVEFRDTLSYHCRLGYRDIRGFWVQERVAEHLPNGPTRMQGYPWFVHRGVRYRYSAIQACRYELVDQQERRSVRVFNGRCDIAYDGCADERARANDWARGPRFFCGERLETWFGPTRCPY